MEKDGQDNIKQIVGEVMKERDEWRKINKKDIEENHNEPSKITLEKFGKLDESLEGIKKTIDKNKEDDQTRHEKQIQHVSSSNVKTIIAIIVITLGITGGQTALMNYLLDEKEEKIMTQVDYRVGSLEKMVERHDEILTKVLRGDVEE